MGSEKKKDIAWEQANIIKGKNPNLYREDAYGNQIYKPSYGKQTTMGWEIDHKHPLSKGGTDTSRNIHAVQWEENRTKSNKYPYKNK